MDEQSNAEQATADLKPWRSVVVLSIIYCFGTLDRQMMALLVTPIKRDIQLSDVQIGLLQGAAFALFFVLASFPVGRLVDRVSRRLVILWGTFVWSLAAMGSGLAANFAQLFAARAAVGAGESTLQPAAFAMLADRFPPERLSLPMSVFVVGANLGSGLSLVLGGLVIDWASTGNGVALPLLGALEPWRLTFILTGLPGLLLVFLIFTVPEPRRRQAAPASTAADFAEVRDHYRAHWRFYLAHNLGFTMCIAFAIGLLSWNPAFFGRKHGLEPGEIGLWLGATQMVTATLGLAFHGTIVDHRFRKGKTDAHLTHFMLMCPLGGILAAAGYLVENTALAILLFNLGLFCLLGYPGVGAASLQIATPPHLRGRISAIYLIFLNLIGAASGPLIIAAITDYVLRDEDAIGQSMAIFAIVIMLLASFCLALGRSGMRRAIAAQNFR